MWGFAAFLTVNWMSLGLGTLNGFWAIVMYICHFLVTKYRPKVYFLVIKYFFKSQLGLCRDQSDVFCMSCLVWSKVQNSKVIQFTNIYDKERQQIMLEPEKMCCIFSIFLLKKWLIFDRQKVASDYFSCQPTYCSSSGCRPYCHNNQ